MSTTPAGPRRGAPRDPPAPGPADPAAGWERRFVGAPPRLREHIELYESLGLEVRLEPVPEAELAPECAGCTLALSLFRVIYTRRRT